ncbi:hypothetical protein [Streptomyces sp. YIM 98790]|uniref:hypothetical protein n=1 Tax=Streptomyces sp. YIM 98790 TaxID=2689077 RepID=UPI00140E837A|nr:hypothetical protein [Streptomyces sp. YIM 98790]
MALALLAPGPAVAAGGSPDAGARPAQATQAARTAQTAHTAGAARETGGQHSPAGQQQGPGWTREAGQVVWCQGGQGDSRVVLDLYQNSVFGAHVSLSAEVAGVEYGGGGPVAGPLFDDGTISAPVAVEELGEGPSPAPQEAVISGSYAEAGPRQRVREVVEEPFGTVVSKGWRTPLTAEAAVEVLGQEFILDCTDAFAFDLRVRRGGTAGE